MLIRVENLSRLHLRICHTSGIKLWVHVWGWEKQDRKEAHRHPGQI
jgi:hypothetical protein